MSSIHLANFVKNNSMILITFNYRLRDYSFLCLGTENVPGNAGMKDQAALLRWVNQNIAQFGGNPNDVTVMGCSAGWISTDLLTISNMTNSLFHKAIPESGCSYGAIAIQYDPIQNAKDHARLLNFSNVDDIAALEEFYMTVSTTALAMHSISTLSLPDSSFTFAACLERDVGVEMFLQDDRADILKNGDFPAMPLLYGLAKDESMFRLPNILDGWLSKMNEKFSDFLPNELEFKNVEEKERVANTVRAFYFGNRSIGISTIPEYVDFHTDVLFGYRMMKGLTLRLGAKDQPIYLHQYSFVDENTTPIMFTNVTGTNHCEQYGIISDHNNMTGRTDAYMMYIYGYINMQYMMRSLWTNYILTGRAVSSNTAFCIWPPTQRPIESFRRCWSRLFGINPCAETTIGTIIVGSTSHMSVTSCAKSKYLDNLSFSALTRLSSCGMVTSASIARRDNRSTITISGLLATIVLSVIIDRSQYSVA
ncbi:hypothetical protein O3G_MSEX012228 [Manduca sexta]|uniref:Carboxylic ester hydrolase n=1 Tax=Manduca sexta TaxID=7130 RepID=A0A922CWE4_MANSE|nr:hypothetical protein O3G_MSEX012228 [Manduca sexta]UXP71951.1 esterase [Manduca sexta]